MRKHPRPVPRGILHAWNYTQSSGIDATARFDPTGNQVNPTLGQYTAARSPREIQLAVRLDF